MNRLIVVGLAVVLVLGAGGLAYLNYSESHRMASAPAQERQVNTEGGSEDMARDKKAVEGASDEVVESTTNPSYKGRVFAGSTSPYLDFTKSDYDDAVKSGRIIMLDFYAEWCPICRSEAPAIVSAFNAIHNESLIGFRVNFKDDHTDRDESALARQYNVPVQHTKVFIKDGQEIGRSIDQWDDQSAAQEIAKYTQ